MSMLEIINQKQYKTPAEGKHTVVIKSYKYTERKDTTSDMLTLETVLDDKRDYNITLFLKHTDSTTLFDISRDLHYLSKRLLENFDEGLTPFDLIDKAISEKTKLDVWFSYNTSVNEDTNEIRTFTNYRWFAPTEHTDTTTTASAQEQLDKILAGIEEEIPA